MNKRCRVGVLSLVVSLLGLTAPAAMAGSYDALVALFREWRTFQQPRVVDGVPDYSRRAMEEQRRGLGAYQQRLKAIDRSGFSVADRIDWELVRAEMNGLDFDHRVLRPWARDPAFYRVIHPEESDVPTVIEGPLLAGSIYLWRYAPPLPPLAQAELRAKLRVVPKLLAQAKTNLVEDVRDLWPLGVRVKKSESAALASYAKQIEKAHPELVTDVEGARRAVDEFRVWLESELPNKKGPAGVGVADYDWYLKNVHLTPFTWQDEVTLFERELGRARAYLALLRHQNRELPELQPAASAEIYLQRSHAAVTELMRFLDEKQVLTVSADMEPALRARIGSFTPAEKPRDFFTQIDLRDPLPLRCHGTHWFDIAGMSRAPHPSPIRSVPSLYNIWDGRAEGLATAMEELMLGAGLFAGKPRSAELVYVLVANRAARGLAGLLVHGRKLSFEQALRFAHDHTPYGWLIEHGDTNWTEQQLYLQQPGYGTSYLTGKAQIESLLGELGREPGFELRSFFDRFFAAGLIPMSLIHWELTGNEDELRRLR